MGDKERLENIRTELAKLPQDVLDNFLEFWQRHSYSVRLDAHHSVRSILVQGSGSCSRTYLVVVSGRDQTDGSGKAVLPIHRLLCGASQENLVGAQIVLVREPQFVATPLSSVPVFATALTKSTPAQAMPGFFLADRDNNPVAQPFLETVEVHVMTWKPDGTAAANTFFSWICTVEAVRLTSLGG